MILYQLSVLLEINDKRAKKSHCNSFTCTISEPVMTLSVFSLYMLLGRTYKVRYRENYKQHFTKWSDYQEIVTGQWDLKSSSVCFGHQPHTCLLHTSSCKGPWILASRLMHQLGCNMVLVVILQWKIIVRLSHLMHDSFENRHW